MNRYRNLLSIPATLFFIVLFFTSCSVIQPQNPYGSSNTGNPMEPTRQVNRVYPFQRDNNRYLDSNKKKKKSRTKIRQIYGFDCPWDKTYSSKAHKKIERKLWWRKLMLKREIRRNK
ncbi:MAG: hypothetical protein JW723_13130 [Bacteroidales bacterium]|nr:hypothetical protein [Bacteroidales bacterium]